MGKKRLLTILGAAALLTVAGFTVSGFTAVVNADGRQVDETDSPVDGPGDCSSCHGGGTAAVGTTLTASPAFGAGNTYIPNTTYTISVGETGYPYYGFDLEICNSTSTTAKDAGTFVAATANCKFHAPTSTYPTNVTQITTTPKTSKSTFTWKAPASGTCYIYMDMNGVNGDGTDGKNDGDKATPFAMTLITSPTGIAEAQQNKTDLNLFPNPVSDNVNLTYTLSKTSKVTINVYDLTGKLVSNLMEQTLDAGNQTFHASLPAELSKGIYELSLTVDGVPTVKKLMVR